MAVHRGGESAFGDPEVLVAPDVTDGGGSGLKGDGIEHVCM